MKIVPKFKITIKSGKIFYDDIQSYERHINTLEGVYYLTIKKQIKDRSNKQNRFYWLYLNIISKDTGDTPEDLHEYFKRIYLKPKIIKVMGKSVKIPSSTTNLDKLDFTEYMNKIEALTGIPIPDPNSVDY